MRKIQIRLTVVASAVSVMLAGCGGGGGGGPGGGGNPYLRSSVPYHTPKSGGSYQTLANGSTSSVIQDLS